MSVSSHRVFRITGMGVREVGRMWSMSGSATISAPASHIFPEVESNDDLIFGFWLFLMSGASITGKFSEFVPELMLTWKVVYKKRHPLRVLAL